MVQVCKCAHQLGSRLSHQNNEKTRKDEHHHRHYEQGGELARSFLELNHSFVAHLGGKSTQPLGKWGAVFESLGESSSEPLQIGLTGAFG